MRQLDAPQQGFVRGAASKSARGTHHYYPDVLETQTPNSWRLCLLSMLIQLSEAVGLLSLLQKVVACHIVTLGPLKTSAEIEEITETISTLIHQTALQKKCPAHYLRSGIPPDLDVIFPLKKKIRGWLEKVILIKVKVMLVVFLQKNYLGLHVN